MQLDTIMNSCLTIVFINKGHDNPTPIVWVCQSRKAFDASIEQLRANDNMEIIQSGLTHVVEE